MITIESCSNNSDYVFSMHSFEDTDNVYNVYNVLLL